jgi:DNA-binding transcriptional LysR family regulator
MPGVQIPSTQALKVFEASARLLNITHAAEELCLTPSAVSKQLQSLEESVGVALFMRGKQGLRLTDAGQVYLDCIKPAMNKLAEAMVKISRQISRDRELQVRVLPSFADRWLIPRYPEFTRAHPEARIRFNTSINPDEIFPFTYDAYVALGEGSWPGCVADYLCGSQLDLVASPKLLATQPPIRAAGDLARFTLLEHTDIPLVWAKAFEDLGLKPGGGIRIDPWDFYSVIIRCACAGLGIALLPRCFIAQELGAGDLVRILDYSQRSTFGYYFLVSRTHQDDPAISRFRNWLLARRGEGEDRTDDQAAI